MIADSLAEIGISTTVEPMSMENLQEKLSAGSFDLALVSFAMDVCPDPGFMLIGENVRSGNYCRYKSSKMDELFKSLRSAFTREEYRQRLLEIQSQFYNDCPFVCLYWRTGNIISRYMFTACRDVREYELLRGIESFFTY